MKVLVTGASGMLGAAVADALAARGDQVTVLQRRPSGLPHREVLADIADPVAVGAAVAGHDAVVHLAAKVDVTGPWAGYERTNVTGTRVVVDATTAAGVPRLVHVSSPAVAHTGSSLIGAGAGPAEPDRVRGHYARSKAAAERIALGRDLDTRTGRPAVVAIRPHLVWGPGDTQLIGRIVARARTGRLPVIGSGAALIDTTYVTNAADALVAAVDRCDELDGQALVVTNGEPRPVESCWNRSAPRPGPRVPGSRSRRGSRGWPGRPSRWRGGHCAARGNRRSPVFSPSNSRRRTGSTSDTPARPCIGHPASDSTTDSPHWPGPVRRTHGDDQAVTIRRRRDPACPRWSGPGRSAGWWASAAHPAPR